MYRPIKCFLIKMPLSLFTMSDPFSPNVDI